MWKLLVISLLLILLSVPVIGWTLPQQQQAPQPSPPPQSGTQTNAKPGHGGSIENRLRVMTLQLNLTDEQRDKIRPLLKNEADRIREVRSNTNLTQNQARHRVAMVRKNTRQKIVEILTPEQREKWQQMREGRHEGGPPADQDHSPDGAGSGNPPAPQNPPRAD